MTTGNEPPTLKSSLAFLKMDPKVAKKGVQDTVYCVGCAAVSDAFITARRNHASKQILLTVLKRVCTLLHIQADDVCSGLLDENIVSVPSMFTAIEFYL